MLSNFITGLMRSIGVVMFFSGMAMFIYAVVGGYYHYSPLFHAIGWGFIGWVLFFVGKDFIEQHKPADQPVAAPQQQMPVPQPYSPYPNAGNATASEAMRNFGGNPPRRGFDQQNSYD